MTKRSEREHFFKILYMTNFYDDLSRMDDSINNYLENEGIDDPQPFIDRVHMVCDNLKMIDDTINSLSKGWKTTRIAKVDLSLLRMAIYEMKFENQAKGIAINEAVELAKRYGSDRSYAFVNGILSNVE